MGNNGILKFTLNPSSHGKKKRKKTFKQKLKQAAEANSQSQQKPPDTTQRQATGKQKSPEPAHTNGKRAPSTSVARRKPVSNLAKTSIKRMNPKLHAVFEEMRKLLEDGSQEELLNRYDLGEIVAGLDADDNTYGEHAVARLAHALDVGQDLLYDSRRVYDAFPKKEIIRMRSLRDPLGRKITFTHLATIAKAENGQTRIDLINEFFARGLTVAELKHCVQQHRPKNAKKRPYTHRAMLRAIQKRTRGYLRAGDLWTDELYEQLAEAAAQTPKSDFAAAEDLAEDVGRALEALEQLSQVPERWVQRLQEVEATLTQGLDDAKAKRESELDDD